MRQSINPRHSHFPIILLAASLLVLYLKTIAPGLTWANSGSDGGDLITASATGGVPHPTGYPLYLLLARIFQYLPLGPLAFRTNLMSAVFSVLAALLIHQTVTRSLENTQPVSKILGGLAAGWCFALSPLVWSQALITEVYALQAFLTASVLYWYSRPASASQPGMVALDRWRGLTLGLAMANHLTSILLVPLTLLGSIRKRSDKPALSRPGSAWFGDLQFDLPSLGRQWLWLGPGICLYLTLPLRALGHPPVNWGNPLSLDRLWWLVSGALYQNEYLLIRTSYIGTQLGGQAGFLVSQLGIPVILVGLTGLFLFRTSSYLSAVTLWTGLSSLVFSLIYRSADAQVYLVPLLLSFSIWLGLGVAGMLNLLSKISPILGLGLGILVVGYLLLRTSGSFQQVDASQDMRAESFGREALAEAPENSIVFAKGDKAVFTLWYFHFALRERPDLSVLAAELLSYDWYREVMQATYPSLELPESFLYPETIARANPGRAICQAGYVEQAEIECNALPVP